MVQLTKGTNAPLPSTQLVVTVDVAAPADLSALLVREDGKVRSDADFVFYNQPEGPGVRCVPPAGGSPWQVEVDLDRVPADVHAVRLVTSLDAEGRVFGQVGQPVARVRDRAGTTVAEFAMTGLSTETIVVAVELYRRAGSWKVRAVGQGYAGGLGDLIADHGVEVDQPATPPSPSPPAAAPPAASPQASAPPPPAAAPPPPPAVPPSPVERPTVNLTKGRPVSLSKGQRVNLVKDGDQALTLVRMGLGWDPVRTGGGIFGRREAQIDLDASAILFAGTRAADVAFYNNLRSKDGSVQHAGDNLTGEGEGDDEVITVDLPRVPAEVTTIVFVVTSYQGQTFEQVENAFCRLVDQRDGELVRFRLAGGMPYTGIVMAKLSRAGGRWVMQAVGEGIQARTPIDAAPQLTAYL